MTSPDSPSQRTEQPDPSLPNDRVANLLHLAVIGAMDEPEAVERIKEAAQEAPAPDGLTGEQRAWWTAGYAVALAPAPEGLRKALGKRTAALTTLLDGILDMLAELKLTAEAAATLREVRVELRAREREWATEDAALSAPPSPAEPPRPDVDALTAAYRERAMVVAALFRVGGYHPVVVLAPDAPGWWIVYAETPEGQVSWHIAEADLPIFEGTGWTALGTYEWDGHTTDEKYERLSRLRAEARPPEGLDPDRLAEALAVIDPWAADPAFREGARAIVAEYARLLEKT